MRSETERARAEREAAEQERQGYEQKLREADENVRRTYELLEMVGGPRFQAIFWAFCSVYYI